MGPAALVLRMASTVAWLRPEAQISTTVRMLAVGGGWLALCALQPPLCYALKLVAHRYVRYRNLQSGGKSLRVIGAKKHV
jgi:hypothetical protein